MCEAQLLTGHCCEVVSRLIYQERCRRWPLICHSPPGGNFCCTAHVLAHRAASKHAVNPNFFLDHDLPQDQFVCSSSHRGSKHCRTPPLQLRGCNVPNYAPFAPFMTILRSMNVCSIDSRAAMGGRTLIRMLGATGLQITFDQEIANAENSAGSNEEKIIYPQ